MAAAATTTPLEILESQYEATEAFANAQTRLLNSTMTDADAGKAIENLENCKRRVRSALEGVETLRGVYPNHCDLSRRVIQTISQNPSWDPNGIPSHVTNVLETNTVALATLRASISSIQELEP